MVGIFLSMIIARYNDADMLNMLVPEHGAGDVCAGHCFECHAAREDEDEFRFHGCTGDNLAESRPRSETVMLFVVWPGLVTSVARSCVNVKMLLGCVGCLQWFWFLRAITCSNSDAVCY